MRTRSAVVALVGYLLVIEPASAAGQTDVVRPPLMFNGGFRNLAVETKAVASGAAEILSSPADLFVIRHLWLEVFEGRKEASREQVTVFVLCESTFQREWNQLGRIEWGLKNVSYRYVLLDAAGSPVGQLTTERRFTRPYSGAPWTLEELEGVPVRRLYQEAPPWVRAKLALVSGFLRQNPVEQIVGFQTTDAELASTALNVAALLVRTSAASWGGAVAEKILRLVVIKGVAWLLTTDELRWGAAADIANEKAKQFASTYIEVGQQMWASSAATSSPRPPTNVRVVR